jgi:2'-5' RNA ligase superfamily
VLYLAPRPDEPFRALTRAACAAFPGYLPYGGAFADSVPHLTIGERPAGGVADLRAAEAAVLPWLPVRARVSRVWLMAGSAVPGSWHTLAELSLAPG